jgi:hypothetical protein
VKTSSNDKPFVWMTQADGGWGRGEKIAWCCKEEARVTSDTLLLWQSAKGGRMNTRILNENKMISALYKFWIIGPNKREIN